MYAIGRGVPQDYTPRLRSGDRRAAEQGQSWAQFQLGMFYDQGHGVPVDVVEAEKWLILSTASAPPSGAEDRTRIRDAVRTKMTRGELAEARMRGALTPGSSGAKAVRPRLNSDKAASAAAASQPHQIAGAGGRTARRAVASGHQAPC